MRRPIVVTQHLRKILKAANKRVSKPWKKKKKKKKRGLLSIVLVPKNEPIIVGLVNLEDKENGSAIA